MRKIIFLAIAFDFLILDQLSKWAVTEFIIRPNVGAGEPLDLVSWFLDAPERLGFTSIPVLPFFNIVMVWNKGVSFGLFNDFETYGPMILSGVSMVIAAVFTVWLFRSPSKFQSFAIALVLAGAIGNVIDRLRFGAVIDFLDFHAYGYHYPAFNVADSCIVIGVILLMIHAFFLDRPLTNEEKNGRTKHENI